MGIKKWFDANDMTVGSPAGKIVAFTVPMLLGNIAQQLYSTVDSIVVGKYVGDNALAAVGSASPIFNLLLVLFVERDRMSIERPRRSAMCGISSWPATTRTFSQGRHLTRLCRRTLFTFLLHLCTPG